MSLELDGLHPQLRAHADATVRYAQRYYGLSPRITSVYRSTDHQRRLYQNHQRCQAAGLAGRPVQLSPGYSCAWPANPPGYSAHEYHLAWDSVVPAAQQDLWTWIRKGFGWHVPAGDVIHAEYPGWRRVVGI